MHVGDTRQPQTLSPSLFEGVTHVICTTGTTAFPSQRWAGENGPEQTGLPLSLISFAVLNVAMLSGSLLVPISKNDGICEFFCVEEYNNVGDFVMSSFLSFLNFVALWDACCRLAWSTKLGGRIAQNCATLCLSIFDWSHQVR